ncbi:hypothetical protein J1N35_013792, partial [Gossypium stocksii]
STISMERMLFVVCDYDERSINVGRIILKEIKDCAKKRAQVRSKANLKGHYVQGCVTRHDLEILVENIELLNQVEPNEPNELESNESSTKSEPEADLINDIEKVEAKEEPNSLKP